jgi:hypothetical protein
LIYYYTSSVDLLIPPLFHLIRAREIPTALRTSAISLLADCVNTYSLAVLTYADDLANTMVDLIQVESVPIQEQVTRTDKKYSQTSRDAGEKASKSSREDDTDTETEKAGDDDTEKPPETMDNTPTSTNRKFPPLRRAALHFLGLLVKEATRQLYESPSLANSFISQTLMQRAAVMLGYISATDADGVVQVMAREVREGLRDLQKAKLGL